MREVIDMVVMTADDVRIIYFHYEEDPEDEPLEEVESAADRDLRERLKLACRKCGVRALKGDNCTACGAIQSWKPPPPEPREPRDPSPRVVAPVARPIQVAVPAPATDGPQWIAPRPLVAGPAPPPARMPLVTPQAPVAKQKRVPKPKPGNLF